MWQFESEDARVSFLVVAVGCGVALGVVVLMTLCCAAWNSWMTYRWVSRRVTFDQVTEPIFNAPSVYEHGMPLGASAVNGA